ncbi:MAG: hypothetical protein LBQ67_06585 [Treponema sp.]|jgi:hypothetical protein|nr:hypothetical protein [Treponema sp.]
MRLRVLLFFFGTLILGILVPGCGKDGRIPSIAREDLFSLDIGRLEDQIALYSLEGSGGVKPADMAMRDGLFYISDGNGGKILRYNSYGNLLFMIYNEETNPPPMTLEPFRQDNVSTRWAVTYPLLEPGEITVDSRKHIFVKDRLPYERHSYDPESRALLDNIILHFDADGNFVEYLGREGIGGSPFPKIEDLFISRDDELAVVCRLPTGWNIYWFGDGMELLFVVDLKNESVPVPPDRDLALSSLDAIIAAPDSRRLYIKVDYYRDIYDESTNTRTGNEPDSSIIWIMNAEDDSWEKTVEVPFFEYTYTEQNRRVTSRMLYSLLGVMKDEKIFLAFPVEGGYSVLFLYPGSSSVLEQQQGFIQVRDEELNFNAFDLSEEGILSGLLVDDWKVKLVWWRTDKFMGSLLQ